MSDVFAIERFVAPHAAQYTEALSEIRNGCKCSHWMWFIFPQITGLGHSPMAVYYAMQGTDEAHAFYEHPLLGKNLCEITAALLELDTCDALAVMGSPDDKKLRSCMTLFEAAVPECDLFAKVLDKFFEGRRDLRTLQLIDK